MTNAASFAAAPGKRIWAWCFDLLAIGMLFLLMVALAQGFHVDLGSWLTLALLFFAYHLVALVTRQGRTLGKTAVEIMVISASGQPLSFLRSCVRAGYRALPLFCAAWPSRLSEFVASVVLLLLTVTEVRLLERSPTRQTVADHLARSLVVNAPPLEPHRAPAGPMYSASDREFGLPPRRPDRDTEKWHR